MQNKDDIEVEVMFTDNSSLNIEASGIEFIDDFNMVVMEHEGANETTHYYFNLGQLKGFITHIKPTKPKLKAV